MNKIENHIFIIIINIFFKSLAANYIVISFIEMCILLKLITMDWSKDENSKTK